MTDTMLERMAAAAAWEFTPIPWGDLEESVQLQFIKAQRAALQAGRTPTDEMLEAAIAPYRSGNTPEFNASYKKTVAGYMATMIDAILKEGPK